ncbi:c-type cytochrome [Celeribacter indicus]|uniref:Cytochrome c class I n=1 Tax=Celeribacter indicus TaxID=1208324 RepID=A0A0B5E2H8_9RHOB|nr:cytochrome c [Celeribacter indicus]AJE47595.1 cytochrome c class I [Celeribacter indicus]SDW11344.1 Cytochrome c [Celeribacter indicus]
MNKSLMAVAGALALALGAYLILKPAPEAPARAEIEAGAALAAVTLPDMLSPEAQIGKRAFDGICAACHGENAAGAAGYGPPLVHRIYEPSHHGDMAFLMAVERGVQSHHWPFGDMPPQEGLTRGDVKAIVAYVRSLQRANGIE